MTRKTTEYAGFRPSRWLSLLVEGKRKMAKLLAVSKRQGGASIGGGDKSRRRPRVSFLLRFEQSTGRLRVGGDRGECGVSVASLSAWGTSSCVARQRRRPARLLATKKTTGNGVFQKTPWNTENICKSILFQRKQRKNRRNEGLFVIRKIGKNMIWKAYENLYISIFYFSKVEQFFEILTEVPILSDL